MNGTQVLIMAIDVCLSAHGTPCWYSVLGLCLMGEARSFLLLCLDEGIMSGAPCFSGKSASSTLPGTQLHPGDRFLLFGLWPGKEAGCTPSSVHAVTPHVQLDPLGQALQGLHCRSEAEAGVNHHSMLARSSSSRTSDREAAGSAFPPSWNDGGSQFLSVHCT